MTDNEHNFCVEGDLDKYLQSQFAQDMDTSNKVDGKPVYYWIDQHDRQVPNDAGYVAVTGSTNITIRDLDLSKNGQGVLVAYTDGLVVENISTMNEEQGIAIAQSSNCMVLRNAVTNSDFGIEIRGSLNVTIIGNTILNNTDGLYLRDSDSNIIHGNAIASNDDAIRLEYSPANEISDNTVTNNFIGISLAWSGSCTLRDNNVTRNVQNFGVDGNCLQDFLLDMDASNVIEGKPVCYMINRHELAINPSTFPLPGYLAVVNCTSVIVRDLNLTNNSQGILLAYTNNSMIERVIASDNGEGICLYGCDGNTISGNVVTDNAQDGVALFFSTNNNITLNTATSDGMSGIWLSGSSKNLVRNNTFSQNNYGGGITLEDSSRNNSIIENTVGRNLIAISMGINEPHDNRIYHNNFVDNTNQVFDLTRFWKERNTWDDGQGQGNYWSDYNGTDTDGDGIGDTSLPYLGIDAYPLMTKYWNKADVNHDGRVDVLDIFMVANSFGTKIGDPSWDPRGDLDGSGTVNVIDVFLVASEYGETA
jgi:parallel beta-helix repeat protein